MKNKFVIGCVAVIVVFGLMSHVASRYQEAAKDNWTVFLSDKGIDRETILRYAALTRNDLGILDLKIGKADLEIKEALWGRYRYSDYWLSVLRTIVAIAILALIVYAAKFVLNHIYVSDSFYRRFYLPVKDGMGRDKDEK
jgi:hypothetical protein